MVPPAVELVLCCGFPGSGKSTFAKRYFPQYTYVNQDTLKTIEGCIGKASAAFMQKKSVIVDNCNISKDTRSQWLDLAQRFGVPLVRVMWFTMPIEVCQHLNTVRHYLTGATWVPNDAYVTLGTKYQPPDLREGFTSIHKVPFMPNFPDDATARAFLRFTAPPKGKQRKRG